MSLDKLRTYGFYLFLFLLPFQTVFLLREPIISGEKWQYGTIGIYGTDVILFLILIFFALSSDYMQKSKITNHTSSVLLVALILWSGLSVFGAEDQFLTWYFFTKLLLGAGLFFMAQVIHIDVKKVIFVLLLAGAIQSGIGIGQFLYQYVPESSLLGMSAHEASQAGSSVLKIDSGRFLRAYGTFPHPNMLGGFLAVVFVLGIAAWGVGSTPTKKEESAVTTAWYVGLLLIILLGLILTFSRAAWLGVVLGLAGIGWHALRQKESGIRNTYLNTLVILGVAVVVFGAVLYEQIFPRFDTKTIEQEGSVSERVLSFQDAKVLITEYPIIGVGAGNFTAEIVRDEPSRPVWSIQPVHNVFVLIWSELGLIGLSLFVCFLVFTLFPILQSKILHQNSEILIALLVLLPSLFLDHWFWTSHFGILFLFLLLGLSQRKDEA